ncbi:hypothetical protein ACN38_g2426 [Penicillium nordicum]|uniref:Uncharacterized protein n=1 Tax=Penicillium nordicum TaxID=229535 RepID=A0A0M8PFH2_9EURO|nr:hypothetical protein ACN38_g2426 [Penicillium nordicum]
MKNRKQEEVQVPRATSKAHNPSPHEQDPDQRAPGVFACRCLGRRLLFQHLVYASACSRRLPPRSLLPPPPAPYQSKS